METHRFNNMVIMKAILIILLTLISLTVNAQVVFATNGNQWVFSGTVPPPAPPSDTLWYSIVEPVTYTPSGALAYYEGTINLVIENKIFEGVTGDAAITLAECENVIVRNCKFKNLNTYAIHAENAKNLLIENCIFDSVQNGILCNTALENDFNNYNSSGVKVRHNYFRNIMGGAPGYHAVMFAGVSGGNGNQINYNTFENIHLQSHVDDIVSCFKCFGTVSDSLQIMGNWFRGGDHNAENHTGGAITVGDSGGSYIHIKNNYLINVVGGGIGNAGANNVVIERNYVLQEQYLANPTNNANGIISVNYDVGTIECFNITVQYNRIQYNTYSAGIANYAFNGTCGTIIGVETDITDMTMTPDVLPTVLSDKFHY